MKHFSQIAGVADVSRRRHYALTIMEIAERIAQRPWCPDCQSTGWKLVGPVTLLEPPPGFGGEVKARVQCTCDNGKRIAEAWANIGLPKANGYAQLAP